MSDLRNAGRTGPSGLVHRIVEVWALLGGVLLLAVVGMNVWSVASSALLGAPLPGDFEMVELGVAVAAFSFLPYCQIEGANVTADIFTAGASRFWQALFALLGAVAALGFGLLLLWRMYAGMLDYIHYTETTAILQIPIWWAFPPILASLALLAAASVVSLAEALSDMRSR